MSHPIRILYLDDEEQNLFSFQALFRRDFEVYTTTSVQEAVNYLNKHEVAVIFSDQKMPEVSGVEFFESIVHNFPDAVRILITGFADMDAVIDAINKGQVYRYITKPWDVNELKICIDNAVEKYKRDKDIKLKNAELQKINSELEKFIYSASHDLRAPVASIQGVVQLAKTEGLEGNVKEYMNHIERSANTLNEFLVNIIYYYQNLKDDEQLKEIDLKQFADRSLNKAKKLPGADEVTFDLEVTQSSPFKSDDHRLKMAMDNLLANAVKFRDPSKPEKKVAIHIISNQEKLVVKINDNGLGIPEEKLPLIFDLFSTSHDRTLGSGLGLYITKESLMKLGGKISVTSRPGEETRVTFEVPNKL